MAYRKIDSKQSNDKKTKPENRYDNVLSYLKDFVVLLSVILLVLLLLFRVVIVEGPSMNNTLVDGDYVILLNNVLYRNPQQGDIVVVSKDSFKNGEPIIKRVIATEGQTVDIDFTLGVVSVDGKPLDEPYTLTPTNIKEGVSFPLTVEKGCIFVMGDNRNKSQDSRSPEIGLVDCREVMGKAIFLVLPGTNNGAVSRDFGRIGALWQ